MWFGSEKYKQNLRQQLTDPKTPTRFTIGNLIGISFGFLLCDLLDTYDATGHFHPAPALHRYVVQLPARLIIQGIISIAFWWILTFVVRYYRNKLPAPAQTAVSLEPGVWPPAPSDPQTGDPLPPPTGGAVL